MNGFKNEKKFINTGGIGEIVTFLHPKPISRISTAVLVKGR
jgi:hypothetical protein